MRADANGGGTRGEEQLERRQRGADSRVVGHAPVLERDVQVGADEHALAGDVRVANRPDSQSSFPTRSTKRHE